MAQEDKNMLEAWKSGGDVDGKGVNDGDLLAHFRKRRDALDASDPEWDEWDQRLDQYGFSIEESKMSLKWDQGKVSEAQMSAFYSKWEGKATPNSEFQRTLASQAAKWRSSADAKRSAGRRAGSASNHAENQNTYYTKHVASGAYLNDALVVIAKQYGAMPLNGKSLDDLDPNSAAYTKFMDVVDDGITDDPLVQSLITQVTTEIRKTQPDFQFKAGDIATLMSGAQKGSEYLVSKSTSKTESKMWLKLGAEIRGGGLRIAEAPAVARAFVAQDNFEAEANSCNGDPTCVRAAAVKYRDKLLVESEGLVTNVTDTNLGLTAAYGTTLRMLDTMLDGKPVTPQTDANSQNAYGLMNPSEGALFVALGNSMVEGERLLDEGGWVSSSLRTGSDGQPILDDNNEKQWDLKIHSPTAQPPVGATRIEGTARLEDGKTPVFYAFASDVPLVTTVGGQPIDPRGASIGGAAPALDEKGQQVTGQQYTPYAEVEGVPGVDGKFSTVFRSGSNAPGDPFVFYANRPNIKGLTLSVDAEGNNILTAESKSTVDPTTGQQTIHFDATEAQKYMAGTRMVLPSSGPGVQGQRLVPGSFLTPESASLSGVIENLYAVKAPKAGETAAKLVVDATNAAIAAKQAGSPNADALWADVVSLDTTTRLREYGYTGASLDAAVLRMNTKTPEQSAQEQRLSARGITPEKYGQSEVDRRLLLLAQVDKYAPQPVTGLSGMGGIRPGSFAGVKTQAQLREEVFNPQIGVSQIKVPGMPELFGSNKLTIDPNAINPAADGRGRQSGVIPAPVAFPAPKQMYGPPVPEANMRPGLASQPAFTPLRPPTVNAATGFLTAPPVPSLALTPPPVYSPLMPAPYVTPVAPPVIPLMPKLSDNYWRGR